MRIDPAQQRRLQEIRDNLLARITEAEREGWTGEAEGLHVNLAAAEAKLAQVDGLIARRNAAVDVGQLLLAGAVGVDVGGACGVEHLLEAGVARVPYW